MHTPVIRKYLVPDKMYLYTVNIIMSSHLFLFDYDVVHMYAQCDTNYVDW